MQIQSATQIDETKFVIAKKETDHIAIWDRNPQTEIRRIILPKMTRHLYTLKSVSTLGNGIVFVKDDEYIYKINTNEKV